ncbi:MAG: hypothetical protein V4598_00820 [Bdellovibrionota bacterium]
MFNKSIVSIFGNGERFLDGDEDDFAHITGSVSFFEINEGNMKRDNLFMKKVREQYRET